MRQNASKKKQNTSKLLSFSIYNYGSNIRLNVMKWVIKTSDLWQLF